MYLYWSIFGMEDLEYLHLTDQSKVLEAAGLFIYGFFFILVVLVLLNALIAVMSNVYIEVEVSMGFNYHNDKMISIQQPLQLEKNLRYLKG